MLKNNEKYKALESCPYEITSVGWLPIKPKGRIFLVSKNNSKQLNLTITTNNFSPELLTLCKTIDFGYCICGRAAAAKEILFVDCVDHRHDITFPSITPHGHYSLPFFNSKQELTGILVLYVEHGHKSTKAELSFLKLVSFGLGAVCERYEKEERSNELEKHKMGQIMLATLSHEINNPLTICFGKLRRIKKEFGENSNIDDLKFSLERITKVVKKNQSSVDSQNISLEDYLDEDSTKIIKIN